MNLADVRGAYIPRRKRKRVGRGPGSGHGKTCGRERTNEGGRVVQELASDGREESAVSEVVEGLRELEVASACLWWWGGGECRHCKGRVDG